MPTPITKGSLSENWTFYTNWLQEKLPYYSSLLNPGASNEEIVKLESYLGFSLPEQFKELYATNNGEKETKGMSGTFLGFEFLSVDGIIREHKIWTGGDELDIPGTSFPEKAIKLQYFNPKWVPLLSDAGGNHIGIDMDPDSEGTEGQVINFGRDEEDKFVIAKDLNEFLVYIRSQIENGSCDKAITEEDEGEYSFGLTSQSHLTDDLREVFGKKD